jgi:methionyl-tRNA formyltransferase
MMKIVLFAFQDVGVETLKILVEHDYKIQVVYTHPMNMDKNEKKWFKSVKQECIKSKLLIKERIALQKRDIEYIKKLQPDVILSVGWRRLFPKTLLKIPKIMSLNVHGSLLPKYKGFAPINWAILMGEKETGITVHVMDEKVDSGDIVIQKKVKIADEETAYDVYLKIIKILPKTIIESLKIIHSQKNFLHQNKNSGFIVTKRFPLDGKINWKKDRKNIHNQIRALSDPYPNAFCTYNNKKILIKESKICKEDYRGMPGRICSISSSGVVVTCGEDSSKNQSLLITKIEINKKIFQANEYFTKLWCDLY